MSVEDLLKRTDTAAMAEHSEEPPDEVLVVAAIVGDLEAFNQLVLRYRAAVLRVAASIVGRDDAEDVAQDAWLLAFKALPSIEEPRKFAAWLSAVTRNRARRVGQSESRIQAQRVAFDEVLIEKLAGLSAPTDALHDEELKAALDNVSSDYSLVLKLRFLDEMPLKHIAAFLGAPLSTVKWRLHQGKKLLRAQLADKLEERKIRNGK